MSDLNIEIKQQVLGRWNDSTYVPVKVLMTDSDRVFVLTYRNDYTNQANGRLFYSDDLCETFNMVPFNKYQISFRKDLFIGGIATGNTILVLGNGQVWRSTDNGETWATNDTDSSIPPSYYQSTVTYLADNILSFNNNVITGNNGVITFANYTRDVFFINDGRLFAPSYYSDDNGSNWIKMMTEGLAEDSGTGIYKIKKLESGRLIGVSGGGYIYYSDDNGSNWTVINESSPNNTLLYLVDTPDKWYQLDNGIVAAVKQQRPGTISANSIVYSEDDCITWTDSLIPRVNGNPVTGSKITSIDLSDDSQDMIVTGSSGSFNVPLFEEVEQPALAVEEPLKFKRSTGSYLVYNPANNTFKSVRSIHLKDLPEYLDKRGLATVIDQIKNSSGAANEFVGTQAEWDALTAEEQNAYDKAYIKKEAEASNEYIGSEEAWDALTAEEQNAYTKAYFV